jgi:hypothetical protein
VPGWALYFAKTLLYLSAAIACAAVSVLAIVATRDMEAARTQAAGVVTKLNLGLDEVHRLTLEAGLTAKEAREASAKENAYLDQANSQLGQSFGNFNQVLISLRRTVDETGSNQARLVQSSKAVLDAAAETVRAAQPAVEDLDSTVQQLHSVLTDANEIVADPNIPIAIANLTTMSGNFAVISTDGRQVVEKYAHPGKKKLGFWSGIWAAAQIVHKLSPPLF